MVRPYSIDYGPLGVFRKRPGPFAPVYIVHVHHYVAHSLDGLDGREFLVVCPVVWPKVCMTCVHVVWGTEVTEHWQVCAEYPYELYTNP